MRLDQILDTRRFRNPDKIAIVDGERRRTFGQIERDAEAFAGTLRALGVRRGDRVAVFMENSAEAVVALFGALKAGAVVCPLDPTLGPADLTFILNDSRALALVTQSTLADTTAAAMRLAPSVRFVAVSGAFDPASIRGSFSFEDALDGTPLGDVAGGSDFDAAVALYATDTTGFPVAEPISHRNAVSRAVETATYFVDGENEIVLTVLPFAFEHAFFQLVGATQAGATVVLETSRAVPQAFSGRAINLNAVARRPQPAFRRIGTR